MELFEKRLTKSIISAIWLIIKLTDHFPQNMWSKCKAVIEELIKKKKIKSNLGKLLILNNTNDKLEKNWLYLLQFG